MDHLTFFKDVKERILSSYVFIGTEEFVKERAMSELRAKVLDGANEDFNLQVLGEETEIYSVYESVSLLPFMGNRRMVIWDNPKVFTKELSEQDMDLLKQTLSTLHDSVCLLILLKGEVDKRRKYFKVLKDNSTIVEFNPLSEFDAAKWIRSFFKKRGKEIDFSTSESIVATVGTSVMDLNNEAEKIYAVMNERLKVEQQDLRVVSGSNINFGVFEMISCFLNGKHKKAMEEMYMLIKSKESGFAILGAVSSKLRSYYQAQILLESGMNKAEIAEKLGGGYGAKKAIEECAKISRKQIFNGVEALEYADYAIKNGLLSEAAAVEYAVTQSFVVKL